MSNPISHGRRAAVSKAPRRKPSEPKREATRRLLMTRALALFQKKGVDGTTMRDIAKAAKLSLGAAYYYFPSKEALVFAFYEEHQARQREELTGTLRERLGALFHGKLEAIQPQRAMLASIIAHLVNPKDPLSAFSSQSQSMREDAIAMFARAVGDAVPAEVRPLVANALWLLHLAAMLVFVHDDSPDQRRTHGLLDDGLDLLVPLLPLLGTPMGQALVARVSAALGRAEITLTAARPS